MAVKVKKPNISTGHHTFSGDTLKDLADAISTAGVIDPNDGGSYAGSCSCEGTMTPNADGKVKKKGEEFEAVVKVKSIELSFNVNIVLPKLGQNKLSAKAKKEWARFAGAVSSHENGHVADCTKTLEKYGKNFDKIKPITVVNKDKKKAIADSQKQFQEAVDKEAKKHKSVTELLTASVIAYDKKTGHGKSQGATLDASIT